MYARKRVIGRKSRASFKSSCAARNAYFASVEIKRILRVAVNGVRCAVVSGYILDVRILTVRNGIITVELVVIVIRNNAQTVNEHLIRHVCEAVNGRRLSRLVRGFHARRTAADCGVVAQHHSYAYIFVRIAVGFGNDFQRPIGNFPTPVLVKELRPIGNHGSAVAQFARVIRIAVHIVDNIVRIYILSYRAAVSARLLNIYQNRGVCGNNGTPQSGIRNRALVVYRCDCKIGVFVFTVAIHVVLGMFDRRKHNALKFVAVLDYRFNLPRRRVFGGIRLQRCHRRVARSEVARFFYVLFVQRLNGPKVHIRLIVRVELGLSKAVLVVIVLKPSVFDFDLNNAGRIIDVLSVGRPSVRCVKLYKHLL